MTVEKIEGLGLGILSWHGYDSVRASLESYRAGGLLDFFDEKLLFLPEISAKGQALGAEFGLRTAGTPRNLGILGGFQAMAEQMTSPYVLLAENDYQLIVPGEKAYAALKTARDSLTVGQAQVWRFRHLQQPGDVFDLAKHERYWPAPSGSVFQQIVAAARRLVRPGKARRLSGFAPYIYKDPEVRFPRDIQRTAAGDYLVSSRILNWANNIFMIRRDFFLDEIISAALAHQGGRLVNGFPTIETELNRSRWWREKGFWIGVSNPGLFTHARQGDRGY